MNDETKPPVAPAQGSEIVECPECNGRGGWDIPEDCIVCDVCGGSGRVHLLPPNTPAERREERA